MELQSLAAEQFCYVTTKGRVTGHPHEIEICFALADATLYILCGGRDRSDWVRNILAAPQVIVRIGQTQLAGRGRIVDDPTKDALARRLLLDKYTSTYSGDLTGWGRTALPVAIDLDIA